MIIIRHILRCLRLCVTSSVFAGYLLGAAVFFILKSVDVPFPLRHTETHVAGKHYTVNTSPRMISTDNKPGQTDDGDDLRLNKTKNIRLLCFVPTGPMHFRTRDVAVKQTWGKRCDILLFITAEKDPFLPTIGLNITEGWKFLTAKTMQAFRYVFKNHLEDADWFMKVDDDTFVVMENLRYFLASQNTDEPVFFGHHYSYFVKQGYHGGGAGYVLSKEALRRFGRLKYNECREEGGAEDLEMGKCMEKIGVVPGNSRDALNRILFHTYSAETHVTGAFPAWIMDYDRYGLKQGVRNISDRAISFHYTRPHQLYEADFFIYHLRPYGNEIHHNPM